jgi:hypothetical protein
MSVNVTVEQARAWVGVPAELLPDDQFQVLFDGEKASQAKECRVDPDADQPALDEALLRRVARAVEAKGLPLGVIGDGGEFGPVRLASDSELFRLEGPWRKFVFA